MADKAEQAGEFGKACGAWWGLLHPSSIERLSGRVCDHVALPGRGEERVYSLLQ